MTVKVSCSRFTVGISGFFEKRISASEKLGTFLTYVSSTSFIQHVKKETKIKAEERKIESGGGGNSHITVANVIIFINKIKVI